MPLTFPKLLKARPRKVDAPLPATLDLDVGPVPLVVRRNPRAKRLIMRLVQNATVVSVTVPPRTSNSAVLDFVTRNKVWAETRIGLAPALTRPAPGVKLPFRGSEIEIVHEPGRRATRLEAPAVPEDCWRLRLGGAPEHLARRVEDALKREARRDLQAAVDRHAQAVGLLPSALSLKDTRSRWGSCTADRRLAFSWRIVMAPAQVLDYLAAHEVAHFRQMNHGPDFWALCRALCPDMDVGRIWLKRHGAGLHAICFH